MIQESKEVWKCHTGTWGFESLESVYLYAYMKKANSLWGNDLAIAVLRVLKCLYWSKGRTSGPSHTTITNHIEELHLTLNASKCKYILGSRKRQPLLPPQEISISSCQIERVQSYCYLEVIVNQRISWSEHIQHLCLKCGNYWYAVQTILYLGQHLYPSYCAYGMHSTTFRVRCSAMGSMQQER